MKQEKLDLLENLSNELEVKEKKAKETMRGEELIGFLEGVISAREVIINEIRKLIEK